tara:strand:- start:345 stop:728 length:384 start_codon:yes stop_codon:yes gene_type:complete
MSDVESEPVVTEEPVVAPKTKKARKKAAKIAADAEAPVVPAPAPTKKGRKKAAKIAAEEVKEPAPVAVKVDKSTKMTDAQKTSLREHMLAQHADGKMSVSEGKSMRMKLMSRMRKGMTLEEAHKDIA